MRAKNLLIALALPTIFAACTADEYALEQGENAISAKRKAVGEVSFIAPDASTRLVYDGRLKWTEDDKLGAALMDELNGGAYNEDEPASNYTIVDKIFSNYQYDYDGSGFSNGNATLVEGNYFVYAQFNKNQKRSGLAYSIQPVQETGTGYDAWYKNQFFLDHIFIEQGNSQVEVNTLPVFPKINMAIAYEGTNSAVQVRKVIVKDETAKFALDGAVYPKSANNVNYNALANVTAESEDEDFNAADYQVTTGTLADVFNAYKKAVADYNAGLFTLGEGESANDFVSPNIAKFIYGAKEATSMTLNYTTPAASVKGVMVLPLSETHTATNLVIEIYTSKGLVTLAGADVTMSKAMTFSGVAGGQAYDTESEFTETQLLEKAKADIRFNRIDTAFVMGMSADALEKVEIGFKDNAILVPAALTVTSTEELKYYLANWYAGKKGQIVGVEGNNTVTINAVPAEGETIKIDNEVLAFINNTANPALKFNGKIEIIAGTSADALNKLAQATTLEVTNNATLNWTATQAFSKLTNKGTLTIGTGAENEEAIYTVANAIVNEGTMTINKTLLGANAVYNVGTLTVNAPLGTLVNGVAKAVPAKEADIVATAVANIGKVGTLDNYATVNAATAEVGTLNNYATVSVTGALKVTGSSINASAITVAANATMTVTGTFENAADATITNNGQMVVSTAAGQLTNNGKIVNNANISCNADGASFINNKDMEANANSITLISNNNAGAEIVVADNTAIINIPNAATSEGKVTFIVDAQEDLTVIPASANSLRVTASTISFYDLDSSTTGCQDVKMTAKKYLEFRSQSPMTITYFGAASGSTFENVYFNADGATSQVRFNTTGKLTASSSLTVSKNAMVVVNNILTYSSTATSFQNAGQLYVIGTLNFTAIAKPSNAGMAFMGNVFCTGGATANITWPVAGETIVGTADELTAATGSVTLGANITIEEPTTLNNVTIIGNGKTISTTQEGTGKSVLELTGGSVVEDVVFNAPKSQYDIKVTGEATIKGCTFAAKSANADNYSKRAIMISGSGDVTIEDCVFNTQGYALNTSGATGNLVVKNSILNGWTSYDGIASATFDNCQFGKSNYENLVPYVNSTFTNCKFAKGFAISLLKTNGKTLEFTNCKYNNKAVATNNILFDVNGGNGEELGTSITTIIIDGENYTATAEYATGNELVDLDIE